VTTFSYEEKGAVTGLQYPWGEQYFLRYDESGRLVEATGNLGLVAGYEYDTQNNCVAETDACGMTNDLPIRRRESPGRDARSCWSRDTSDLRRERPANIRHER